MIGVNTTSIPKPPPPQNVLCTSHLPLSPDPAAASMRTTLRPGVTRSSQLQPGPLRHARQSAGCKEHPNQQPADQVLVCSPTALDRRLISDDSLYRPSLEPRELERSSVRRIWTPNISIRPLSNTQTFRLCPSILFCLTAHVCAPICACICTSDGTFAATGSTVHAGATPEQCGAKRR